MKFTAISTDPLDLTRALRAELGMPMELQADDPVTVVAASIDGDTMLELMSMADDGEKPVVAQRIRIPHKGSEPAEMVLFQSTGGSTTMQTGLTLWGPMDRKAPLFMINPSAGQRIMITAERLIVVAGIPLGMEASTADGMERATKRLADRFRAIGSFRNFEAKAA